MKTPLTYPDGTKSKLGDLVEVITPRGDKSFGVVVENGEGGVFVVPVPRSSAIFVTSAKPAEQANAEAIAADTAASKADAERLAKIAKSAAEDAEKAAEIVAGNAK